MTPSQPASPPTVSDESTASLPGSEPGFGWNEYAERLNGRFAMIGFIALLVLEFFTRQDFFTWIGF